MIRWTMSAATATSISPVRAAAARARFPARATSIAAPISRMIASGSAAASGSTTLSTNLVYDFSDVQRAWPQLSRDRAVCLIVPLRIHRFKSARTATFLYLLQIVPRLQRNGATSADPPPSRRTTPSSTRTTPSSTRTAPSSRPTARASTPSAKRAVRLQKEPSRAAEPQARRLLTPWHPSGWASQDENAWGYNYLVVGSGFFARVSALRRPIRP